MLLQENICKSGVFSAVKPSPCENIMKIFPVGKTGGKFPLCTRKHAVDSKLVIGDVRKYGLPGYRRPPGSMSTGIRNFLRMHAGAHFATSAIRRNCETAEECGGGLPQKGFRKTVLSGRIFSEESISLQTSAPMEWPIKIIFPRKSFVSSA